MKIQNQRTEAQNNALHLWFRLCAQELNEQGVSQQAVIDALVKHGLDAPWTETSFKENVWKPVQKAMFNEESTSKVPKDAYGAEYEGLAIFFASRLGIVLPPFPSDE